MAVSFPALEEVQVALASPTGGDQHSIAEVGLEWLSTLLRKNRDYGSSAWQRPSCAPHLPAKSAILVRMSDKVARIGQLSNGAEPAVQSEALEDTISDLGSYCLLYLTCPEENQET